MSLALSQEEVLRGLRSTFSCIDNTTLEGTDNESRVRELCDDSLRMQDAARGISHVAAVCVYPVFARCASKCLQGSGIRVAAVAGGFPSGQASLRLKADEARYALDEGADEIDMVINRGAMLEGNCSKVFDEIAAVRDVSQGRTLKVILETGELKTPQLIAQASQLAIDAGADFIKTSTGKTPVSATPEAAEIMLKIIKKHCELTGKRVGFKAAGGISTPDEVLKYFLLYSEILGVKVANNHYFRIGASRLTKRLFSFLVN